MVHHYLTLMVHHHPNIVHHHPNIIHHHPNTHWSSMKCKNDCIYAVSSFPDKGTILSCKPSKKLCNGCHGQINSGELWTRTWLSRQHTSVDAQPAATTQTLPLCRSQSLNTDSPTCYKLASYKLYTQMAQDSLNQPCSGCYQLPLPANHIAWLDHEVHDGVWYENPQSGVWHEDLQSNQKKKTHTQNTSQTHISKICPSPSTPKEKKGPCLNERINVIMNAAARYSLESCWSTSSFLKCLNRYAEALMNTKIRSFKHGKWFVTYPWLVACYG